MATFFDRIAETFGFGNDDAGPTRDLSEWLESTLKDELKVSKIVRDEDGDIAIPYGSSVLYVRQGEDDSPFLTVFALLLEGFRKSPDVYEAVNAINRQIPLAKVFVDEDNVLMVMSIDLPVFNLSSDDLTLAIEIVSTEADRFDTLLQKRFGGTTALEDDDDEIDV